MKKVLLTLPIPPKRLTAIRKIIDADCVSGEKDAYEETCERVGDYEGLLVVGPISKIDKRLLEKGKKLEIISNYGVGYDKIDTNWAKANGIIVANTPHSVTAPTADLAMALMLGVCRRIGVSDRALRNGTYQQWFNPPLPSMSLEGKLLGIIGMGRIGKAVAKRAAAFEMDIAYFQRTQLSKEEEEKYNATYLPLKELLQRSDVVTLHTPLTPSTKHLLGKEELALLKPSAFLINTARGPVVDETALIDCLQRGTIAGAGLDVFDQEPIVPAALLALENVLLTPHIGTGSKAARDNMFKEAITNLVEYFSGETVTNQVA